MMNATPVKVLIVDTDERSYLRMEQLLGAINRPYEVAWAATFDAGRRAIDERWFDVALVDGLLGERNGLDLIYYARDNGCPTPLVLLRGESDEELDAHAMRAGAADCLLREWIDARVLDRAIRCSIERFRVTEQRNAEYAFHESQHVFRTFMDNSPAVSFIKDHSGRHLFVNKQFARLLNTSTDELVGKVDRDLYGEAVAARVQKVDELVFKTGNTITAVDVFEHQGMERYWLTVKFPVRNSAGDLLVGGQAIEISERVRAEKSLRESEERFQLASRATNDAIWDRDLLNGHISWNRNVQTLFRYHAGEVRSDADWWSERLHPDERESVKSSLQAAFNGSGQFWAFEYRFRCGDGSYSYVFDRGYLVRDEHGRPVRMIGAMTDLTNRKKSEDAVRRSEEQFRRIIETTHEGVWMFDAEGRTTFTNARMTEMLGYTSEEMRGRRISYFMDEEGKRIADDATHGDGWPQYDYKFTRKDGGTIWAILSTNPILESDGAYAGALAMVTDITARKLAEEGLREAHDELEQHVAERTAELVATMARLEQAHQVQQRFVADASHDLRTPLTVAHCELDLLLAAPLEKEMRDSLTRIGAELRRLEDLASDLLLLATIDAHDPRSTSARVGIDGIIFDCVAQLRTLSAEKDIVWDVRVEEPIELTCNASMIERALVNVMENAIKYSNSGGTVRVSLGNMVDRAIISVADTGVGIPAHDLPRVFDRFYRGDRTRNTEGTGLGLAIVKAVADAHGGEVELASEPDVGTTVTLHLPL